MDQPSQNQNAFPQQSGTISANEVIQAFLKFTQASKQNELETEKLRIEVEKARLEAEQNTETQNKIYGGALVVLALTAYTVLLWNDKASEGYGVLITAVVTSALAGIFKGIVGKKRKSSEADAEE